MANGTIMKNGICYSGGGGSGSGSNLPDYSTTEQNTGQKWIDGNDIYVKTFNYTSVPNQTTTEDLTALDIDVLIDAKGMFSSGDGTGQNDYSAPIPYVEPFNVSSSSINMFYLPYSKTFNVRKSSSGMTVASMFYTIWYTKSTT